MRCRSCPLQETVPDRVQRECRAKFEMNASLGIVLVLLASAIVMFAINKPRLDAVALIMLVALPFTGVLTVNEALSGFSDPNIVLIAALFVIGVSGRSLSISFQGPISSNVSPARSFSFKRSSVCAPSPRRKPIAVSPNSLRKFASTSVLPASSEAGGTMTSAIPISCDRSEK